MKMKQIYILLICLTATQLYSQTKSLWGDQGNGTYINPVLNADYSDPDVIRVKNKYYMVCSEFHYMGMTIQESDDMVNWRIVGRLFSRLDFPQYDNFTAYGNGSWAPSIRFHDNKFWVYFCTPDEGLFMTTATNPEGLWTPLLQVVNVKGWEDPCPFWENGQAYLGHSLVGAGPMVIHKMSADGTKLLDNGNTVYTGPVAEGTKIYKRNDFYYISIPEGGVAKGWQTVLRSKNIYGPYEKKVVLETGNTGVNGPHQGAMVENPKGEWWFYHFQLTGALGRVMHLQPMHWYDDWPVIGVDIDRNGIGEPVYVWKKPDVSGDFPICTPRSSDEFDKTEIGLQWQWNHNPINANWSLTQKSGWLSLKALKAVNLKIAHNTLTQKVMGYTGEVITQIDASNLAPGQKAGLTSMSSVFNAIGVMNKGGKFYVFFDGNGKSKEEVAINKNIIYFKLVLNSNKKIANFLYSFDNKNFKSIGNDFGIKWGDWKGTRIGLFSYNELADGGTAAFNFFHYKFDGPK